MKLPETCSLKVNRVQKKLVFSRSPKLSSWAQFLNNFAEIEFTYLIFSQQNCKNLFFYLKFILQFWIGSNLTFVYAKRPAKVEKKEEKTKASFFLMLTFLHNFFYLENWHLKVLGSGKKKKEIRMKKPTKM